MNHSGQEYGKLNASFLRPRHGVEDRASEIMHIEKEERERSGSLKKRKGSVTDSKK